LTAYNKQTEDLILWKNFREGDENAYTELTRRHYKSLLHYGKKFTCNIQLAEDALQDLLIHLWLYRKNLSDTPSIKSYLLKSFRHQLIKAIQAQQTETSLSDQSDLHYPEFPFEETWIQTERDHQIKSHIAHLMDQLPPRQKEVIYLRFFQALKPEEISGILEINPQSVNNILQRALAKLRSSSQTINYYYAYLLIIPNFIMNLN
jgi:RNA polymerase sigma factor (sigma-70 family)